MAEDGGQPGMNQARDRGLMGKTHPHYHVTYIAGSRMPANHDWIYLLGEKPTLLLRVGADERQALDEVADMLSADETTCIRRVA